MDDIEREAAAAWEMKCQAAALAAQKKWEEGIDERARAALAAREAKKQAYINRFKSNLLKSLIYLSGAGITGPVKSALEQMEVSAGLRTALEAATEGSYEAAVDLALVSTGSSMGLLQCTWRFRPFGTRCTRY